MWKVAVSTLFFAALASAGNIGGGAIGYGGGYVGTVGLGGLGGGLGGGVGVAYGAHHAGFAGGLGGGYVGGGGRGYYGGGAKTYEDYRPKPFQFGYVAQGPDGSSSRQEVADGSGRVQGAYTITTAEGVQRKVKYAADAGGFRAVVDTNEPGTASSSPADAAFRSSAPSAAELSARYSASGAGGYVVAKARRAYGGAALGGLYGRGVVGYGGFGGVGGYGVGGGYGHGAGGFVGGVGVVKGAVVHGGHGGAGWH